MLCGLPIQSVIDDTQINDRLFCFVVPSQLQNSSGGLLILNGQQQSFVCQSNASQQYHQPSAKPGEVSEEQSIEDGSDSLLPKEEAMDASTTITDDHQQSQPLTSESYLNMSYSEQHSQSANLMDDCKATAALMTAKELNDAFFHETLELSHEDIQKTLSANMPLGRGGPETDARTATIGPHDSDADDITAINAEINPMDFIDNVTGGVDVPSVHDDDVFVNLDAFDMFVEFPELDLDAKSALLQSNTDMDISHHFVDAGDQAHVMTIAAEPITQSQASNDLYDITDYSPEWAYPEGGIKVLVTGPWDVNSNYTVLFDSFPVPTTVVQTGVLRCYCPAHEVGLATLQVACDGYVISNSCIFEYKSPANVEAGAASDGTNSVSASVSGSTDNLYKLNLYNRLECIDERLQIKTEPADNVSGGHF